MMRTLRLTLALTTLAAATSPAQEPPGGPPPSGQRGLFVNKAGDDPLARFLFPPELVMQQEFAIGLKQEQRAAITQAIQQFQGKIVELQWRIHEETRHLGDLLDGPVVDQAAALTQIDKLLAVEREVKRAHIGLLIQIKNNLTPEQQMALARARAGGM